MIRKVLTISFIVAILSSCQKPLTNESSNNSLSQALGSESPENSEFKKADKIIDFHFPQDHGAHKEFKSEWWYFTGNLESIDKKSFGYQLTIFRNALPKTKESLKSKWSSDQVYMGHFGLSDISSNKFYSYEILEREALDLAGFNAAPFQVWTDDWQVKSLSTNPAEIFPLQLKAFRDGVGIELIVKPAKPLVFQGNQGLSQKSIEKGNASYYYSYTRLATEGVITVNGKAYPVKGLSWMDREWSTSALAQDQTGWNWYALQLDNNHELMFYELRNKDGSIDQISSGTLVKPDGAKIKLDLKDIKIKILEYTTISERKYPSKWQINIPQEDLNLEVKARMKNQEHNFSIPYWEGAVELKGIHKNQTVKGFGYIELTGY